jgi:hypothetical protein
MFLEKSGKIRSGKIYPLKSSLAKINPKKVPFLMMKMALMLHPNQGENLLWLRINPKKVPFLAIQSR